MSDGISDGQAYTEQALTAAQARIAELEKAVTTYKHRHESGGPLSEIRPDSCQCSACDQARALSPKEPAPDPYTNTEGYIGPQ